MIPRLHWIAAFLLWVALESIGADLAELEQQRIATIEAITPAVIAVMDPAGEGGGSGVLVSPDGLALTNFHVVAPCGPSMICGLPDGRTYDATLVGLDPTGDIALIRLAGRDDFPFASVGDSDPVRIGDDALVLGNPFLLATDFRPSVSCGVISGVGRYQYPSDTILEYTDCLQTDAAINPGNSGGPLFDGDGLLIGINGRASFGERGRVNVGVGYAVSINQVKRFLPQMRVGRIVDHASLGATAVTLAGAAVVNQIEQYSAAASAGLRVGDRIVSIDGRPIHSANALKNVIGVYPAGWRVAIDVVRGDEQITMVVRLAPRHSEAELFEAVTQQTRTAPKGGDNPDTLEILAGLANGPINRSELDRVLGKRPADGATVWRIRGTDSQRKPVALELATDRSSLECDRGRFWVDPTKPMDAQDAPPGSGGLLVGFDLLRRVLLRESLDRCDAWGQAPWPRPGEMCDVVRVENRGAVAEFYFHPESLRPVGFEVWLEPRRASCSVALNRIDAEGGVVADVTGADGSQFAWRLDDVPVELATHAEPAPKE